MNKFFIVGITLMTLSCADVPNELLRETKKESDKTQELLHDMLSRHGDNKEKVDTTTSENKRDSVI